MILHRIEEIAQWSPDNDISPQGKKYQPDWLLSPSPDGDWTILVQDDIALLWNDVDSHEIQLGSAVNEFVAWSFDSRYVAISQKDGRVNIIQVLSQQICYCISESKIHQMLVIDPSEYAGSMFDGTRYQYELLLFTADGQAKSYLFQHMERFTIAVRIGASVVQAGSDITYQHSFQVGSVNKVCHADGKLILGGSELQVFKLIAIEPHFQVIAKSVDQKISVVELSPFQNFVYVLYSDGQLILLDLTKNVDTVDDFIVQRWQTDAQQVVFWDRQSFVVFGIDGTLDVQTTEDQSSLLETTETLSPTSYIAKQKNKTLVILELVRQFAICKVRNIKGVVNVQVTEIADTDKLKVPVTLVSLARNWFVDKIRPLSYIVNTITGVHLVDDVDTTTKEFSVPLRTFTLKEFTESSPQNLLQSKLDAQAFDEALMIAGKYNLSKDQVYKENWRQSVFTFESIQSILALVNDQQWQVQECLDRICLTEVIQKALYEHGLSISDLQSELIEGVSGSSVEDKLAKVQLTETQIQTLQKRQLLLELIKRLDVFGKIKQFVMSEGDEFEVVFQEFHQLDAFSYCKYVASCSEFQILDQLLKYQQFNGSQVLEILNAIPEVEDVAVYRKYWNLAQTEPFVAVQDWSFLPHIQHQLGNTQQKQKSDNKLFDDWIKARMFVIDNMSGSLQVACSIDGNKLAQLLHSFMFDELSKKLKLSAVELPEKLTLISLETFVNINDQSRINLLLSRGIHIWQTRHIAEVFIQDALVHVIGLSKDTRLLKTCLISVLHDELELAVQLVKVAVESHKDHISLIADVVADCCIQCSKQDAYDQIQQFYDVVVQLKGAVDRQKLYDIENLLSVAEELDAFGISFKPEVLLKLPVDVAQQKKVLTRMSRLPLLSEREANAKSLSLGDLDGINELLEAMVHIQEVSCPGVTVKDVELLLLQALLSSESERLIGIARQMLFPLKKDTFYHQLHLNHEDIEDLLHSVAQGYFDNAQSGSLKFGLLKYSMTIINLPPNGEFPKLNKLKHYITVVSELCQDHQVQSENGVQMLPLEIKLDSNSVSLLSRAAQSSHSLYKNTEVLTYYHQVLTGKKLSQQDLDLIVYEGALKNEDFELADAKLNTLHQDNLDIKFIQNIKSDVQRKRAYDVMAKSSESNIVQLAMLLPEPI